MYLDLFGCVSGVDGGSAADDDALVDENSGIYVQGPAVSALPLSLALQAAAGGDSGALAALFRKLEEGEIDEGDLLQVRAR
jgi:hypothetical protein